MKNNDVFKSVTLNLANDVLAILDDVPMPAEEHYNTWAAFSSHGAITRLYEPSPSLQERLILQKSHLKLLTYALVGNIDEIFDEHGNMQYISGITQTLESLLSEEICMVSLVQAANSISLLTKLTKPSDMQKS